MEPLPPQKGEYIMPRKAAEKKDKGELIVLTPSESFYQAFLFPTDPPEMQTDISGDTFSHTPEQALRALISHLTLDEVTRIPSVLWTIDGENVAIKESNPHLNKLVMIRIFANSQEDYEKATANYEPISEDEFWVRLKDLDNGYSMGVQDYDIVSCSIRTKTVNDTQFSVDRMELEVSDPERANPAFPTSLGLF